MSSHRNFLCIEGKWRFGNLKVNFVKKKIKDSPRKQYTNVTLGTLKYCCFTRSTKFPPLIQTLSLALSQNSARTYYAMMETRDNWERFCLSLVFARFCHVVDLKWPIRTSTSVLFLGRRASFNCFKTLDGSSILCCSNKCEMIRCDCIKSWKLQTEIH